MPPAPNLGEARPLQVVTVSAQKSAVQHLDNRRAHPPENPRAPASGKGLPADAQNSSGHITGHVQTFRSPHFPDRKICSHRTGPRSFQKREGPMECSRTPSDKEMGAADAGDKAGQAERGKS